MYFTSALVGTSHSAWYHKKTGEVYVDHEAPADIENWEQDSDVLDTWFSSRYGHSQQWAGPMLCA